MDYQLFFKKNDIAIESGLSECELNKAEKTYGIVFPEELKQMLVYVLPLSTGFYNWRDFSEKNVAYIKSIMNTPFSDIYEHADEVYWNDLWGKEPNNSIEKAYIVRTKLSGASKLVPVFAHRYLPMMDGIDIPVISIHGTDGIYYGKNLDEYLQAEFENKSLDGLKYTTIRKVPFWSELIET